MLVTLDGEANTDDYNREYNDVDYNDTSKREKWEQNLSTQHNNFFMSIASVF